MLIRERTIPHARWPGGRPKAVLDLRCDSCGQEFTADRSVKARRAKTIHFCSIECTVRENRVGGKIDAARVATNLARHGVTRTFEDPKFRNREKRERTMVERWGVACFLSRVDLVHSPEQTARRLAAAARTLEAEHGPGVTNPYLIPAVRVRAHSDEANAARAVSTRATCEARYGVRTVLQLPASVARLRDPTTQARRQASLVRNGKMATSSQEDRVALALEAAGIEFERWGRVAGQSIDFVLTSGGLVQVDGVYWHGLDRPIDDIKNSDKKIDRTIFEKWVRDRAFDSFCADEGIRVVRITDLEVDTMDDAQLENWARGLPHDDA